MLSPRHPGVSPWTLSPQMLTAGGRAGLDTHLEPLSLLRWLAFRGEPWRAQRGPGAGVTLGPCVLWAALHHQHNDSVG